MYISTAYCIRLNKFIGGLSVNNGDFWRLNLYAANIMIVDDDEITLALINHIVEGLVIGEVLLFSSSIKAQAFLLSQDAQRIDLVICDWQMPSVSGIKILETLRRRKPDCPFFMITAKPTSELVISAKRLGVTNFIAKPFVSDDLIDSLSKLLDKSSPA
ncbi:MAG: two-component system chemotaxis response regulator CheY [Moritella dasanensis]